YVGRISPFALNPNTTHLIFAMNHETEQVKKMDESEGARAQQLQPLIDTPLPPMTRVQVAAIIQGLNTGIDEEILNTMLSYVPAKPPEESLTILGMIDTVKLILNIKIDKDQKKLMEVLYSIQGTESPIDMANPQHQRSLAKLMVSYYTAIHCKGTPLKANSFFFLSFLLDASHLSGIERLYAKKGDLFGVKEPIQDLNVLKANIKETATVFSDLMLLEEMRLEFLLRKMEDPFETEKYGASFDAMLLASSSLLNYYVNDFGMPVCLRNIKSDKRMLRLIKEYGEKKPELVVWNSLFVSFIDTLSLMLDPFVIQLANTHIDNMSSYFSRSNWDQTIPDFTGKEAKEQKLFEIFKKVVTDAKDNPGNEHPELFQELLIAIEKYMSYQLQKTFTDQNDYQVILVTLCIGFEDLLEQSRKTLLYLEAGAVLLEAGAVINANQQADGAKHDKTTGGDDEKEFDKEDRLRKHLDERIYDLRAFVNLLMSKYAFAMETPYSSESSDTDSSASDMLDSFREE
ncbi:hypothetical protein, partial [Endozoicomonas sp. SESOKO2]|uniref:hypothetical protein n=1 Tax=Endozoicomonas sp. SESOKO2 TaxID=2828743 RepID=UPI0021473EF0